MSGLDEVFAKWLCETRGGKVCPDDGLSVRLSILHRFVTSREGSNPGMDTEVWRQVIDSAATAAHAPALSAMTALVGRTWAASPPDV
eukprot:7381847-Prymnesium_polylepis.1